MTDLPLTYPPIAAYRGGTGDAVADAGTAGWAQLGQGRRAASLPPSGGPSCRGMTIGSGINTSSVTRAWNAFKAASARRATADAGRTDARSRWLGAIGAALPGDDGGPSARLSGLLATAARLSAESGDPLARAALLCARRAAVAAIDVGATALTAAAGGVADEARSAAASVNASLASLAALNQALSRTPAGTGARGGGGLEHRRDSLLGDLSADIGIDTAIAADGSVSISLAGTSGTTLVSGNRAAVLQPGIGVDGALSLAVAGAAVTPGGRLAGLAHAASAIAAARTALGAITHDFADWNASADRARAAPLDLRVGDDLAARLAGLVALNARALAAARAEASAAGTLRDVALAELDDAECLDLDRGAAALLHCPQVCAGSPGLVEVARATLQSIRAFFLAHALADQSRDPNRRAPQPF